MSYPRAVLLVLRVLTIILLCMHGISHVMWFLAAWTPIHAGVKDGAWLLPGDVTIRSPLGKVWGLLALLVVLVFVIAAIGLVLGELWWREVANTGIFLSFGVVVPWWRQSPGSTPINAIIADLALMFLLALPVSVEMVGGA